MIESYTILVVTDDEGEIHLLVSFKYTLILSDTGTPIQNTPHSMSGIFCEIKVGIPNTRQRRPAYHYSQEDNAASGLTSYFVHRFGGFHLPPPKCNI